MKVKAYFCWECKHFTPHKQDNPKSNGRCDFLSCRVLGMDDACSAGWADITSEKIQEKLDNLEKK